MINMRPDSIAIKYMDTEFMGRLNLDPAMSELLCICHEKSDGLIDCYFSKNGRFLNWAKVMTIIATSGVWIVPLK